jgi:3-(3-hydroxy-phenyl)propionate hydroxylase
VQVEADGATATLREVATGAESTVRARWIIGCEGSRSVVREAADIGRKGGQNAGVQIVQGDFRVQTAYTLAPGHGFIWSGKERSLLLLIPLHRDGHYRVLVVRDDDGTQGEPTPDLTISDPLWRNRFCTQHQIADRYRQGRALICGDAAHVWVPIGGQGMNIGIQDAFDLGWKLAGVVKGELPETALDAYDSERRPIGAAHVAETEQMYAALVDVKSPLGTIARRVIPHLVGLGPVSDHIAARFSEIDFHYASGTLVQGHKGYGKLAAGQRAPDAYVARPATGEPSLRLFDLFRAGRWIALGWVLDGRDAEAVSDALAALPKALVDGYVIDARSEEAALDLRLSMPLLRDRPRFASDAYGVGRSGIHLIRPDGVIGYNGPADGNTLRAYCRGAFAVTMEA